MPIETVLKAGRDGVYVASIRHGRREFYIAILKA